MRVKGRMNKVNFLKSKKGMGLPEMKDAVVLIGLVALISAAVAIALTEFQGTSAVTVNGSAYNITRDGLSGVQSAVSFLDVIGVIVGIAVLIGIVMLAFTFGRK